MTKSPFTQPVRPLSPVKRINDILSEPFLCISYKNISLYLFFGILFKKKGYHLCRFASFFHSLISYRPLI